MITIGMTYECEQVVTEALTAEMMGSGDMPVFATPAICSFIVAMVNR